jgi:predicted DNA-binding transcriptional regulator AlpA
VTNTKIAELPESALLDESALADVLGVSKRTIRRMVRRFELPPPIRFAGRSTWICGRVLSHIKKMAEDAATTAEKNKSRILGI